MRRLLLVLVPALLALGVASVPGYAAPLTVTAPVNVSVATPFAPGCGGPTEGDFPGANFNYPNSETEPWIAVSPANPNDVAAMWQQDRWSDGGSHGLLAAVSHDGGATFAYSAPHFSNCAGGTAANAGDYGRSSDPWVSWAPNGDLWSIAIAVDRTTARNAVLASRMRDGSTTWSEPFVLRADNSRTGVPLANNFNDKESLTADPTDASGNLVYAVWDGVAELQRAAPGARALTLLARSDVVRAHDLGRCGDAGVGARSSDLRPRRPQPDDLEPDRRAPERGADRRLLPVQVDRRAGRPRNQHRRDPLDRQGCELVAEGDSDRAGELDRGDRSGADQLPAVHRRQPAEPASRRRRRAGRSRRRTRMSCWSLL